MPFFRRDVVSKLGVSDDDFDTMANGVVMNALSFYNNCGSSFFVKTGWHYCLPFLEDPSFEICSIGQMESELPARFLQRNPLLQDIRESGVVAAAVRRKPHLTSEAQEKLDAVLAGEIAVSVAYRGCMVCKQLADLGAMAPVGD